MKKKGIIIFILLIASLFIFSLAISCDNEKGNIEKTYNVTFTNIDGSILEEKILTEGSIPEYLGNIPTYFDDSYEYTFIGWDKEIEEVNGDTIYVAKFTKELKNDNNSISKEKYPIVVSPKAITNLKYDKTEKELVTMGSSNGGTIYYALGNIKEALEEYKLDIPKVIDAGTYYVWYKVVGDKGYKDIGPKKIKVIVNKRKITIESSSATKTFDGTPLVNNNYSILIDQEIGDEVLTVSLLSSQTSVGTSKNEITYTWNSSVNESNYEIVLEEGDLTVNKIKVSLPSANTNLVYNGEEQYGVNEKIDGEYILYNNVKKDAGKYYATIVLKDKEIYEWDLETPTSEEKNIYYEISKKNISLDIDNKSTFATDELAQLTFSYHSLDDYPYSGDTFTGELETTANKDKVGKYDITIGTLSLGSNYNIEYNKGEYEVLINSQTITFPNAIDDTIKKAYGSDKFIETVNGVKTKATYTSSDTTVATVDSNTGEVTPKKVGTTIITLKACGTDQFTSAEKSYTLVIGYTVTIDLEKGKSSGNAESFLYIYYADDTFDKVYFWTIGAPYFEKTIRFGDDYTTADMPYTFFNVKKIVRDDSFIAYEIDGVAYPVHEFKNGDFVLSDNITIKGTGTGNCIDENSLITMWDGTYKAMKDIEIGDLVLSVDFDTMTLVPRKVIYTSKDELEYENWNVDAYYLHTFSDGTIIKRAMRHRFYSLESMTFKHMDKWEVGMHGYKEDGTNPYLVSTEIVHEKLHYARITLEGSNNFFANGLLTGDSECLDKEVILNTKLEKSNN